LTPSSKGISLSREAWQRLQSHHLAMLSLLFIVVIALACCLAPLLSSIAPETQAAWFHTQAPFSTRPAVKALNHWQLGEASPIEYQNYQKLLIDVQRRDYEDIRVVKREGLIFKIQLIEGAMPLTSFEINQDSHAVYAILRNGQIGQPLPNMTFQLGMIAPAELFLAHQEVAFLRKYQSKNAVDQYLIKQANGKVVEIKNNDQTLSELKLKGSQVQRIQADTVELLITHYLGTDELGRDLYSRILHGGRISILVGLVATLVSLLIGVSVGALSGYLGGKTDRLIMSSVDILYAIPFMFLVILLLVNFGRNLIMLFFALGAVQWLTMSRIIRTQIMSIKQLPYVDAARLCGANSFQIIFHHLLPNCTGTILIYTTLTVPMVIMEESFLSFIGLNVQFQGRSLDSWGTLIFQGMQALGSNGENAWLLIFPAITMGVMLLSLNILGDGLRDAFDPKLRDKD